jgi:hypothetical protein
VACGDGAGNLFSPQSAIPIWAFERDNYLINFPTNVGESPKMAMS